MVAPFLRFDGLLPNMLYACGGRNQSQGPLDTVEMFDTWHGRWVLCERMPNRRAGSAAAVLPDGRLIVVGGYNEKGIAEGLLASCDVYSPARQRWQQDAVSPLARARWGHGCAALRGRIYAVGGCSLQKEAQPHENFMQTLRSCEVLDPEEGTWSPSAPLQIARSGSRVVALEGDRYLAAVGGCDDVFGRAETQATVELFDAMVGHWALLDSQLVEPRTTAAVAAVGRQGLLVFGGAKDLTSSEAYNIALPMDSSCSSRAASKGTDSQEHEEPELYRAIRPGVITGMREGRMGCQAVVLSLPGSGGRYPLADRKCAVIVGGERCEESSEGPRVRQFATTSVFDLVAREWREDGVMPPLSAPRTAAALCVGLGRGCSMLEPVSP